MTEKKSPNNNDTSAVDDTSALDKTAETQSLEQPKSTIKNEKTAAQQVEPEPTTNKVVNKIEKKPMPSLNKTEPASKVSKIGVVAFLLALVALGGIAAGYFWYLQQQAVVNQALRTQTEQQISTELQAGQQQLISQLSEKLQQQKQAVESALSQYLAQNSEEQQEKLNAITKQVAELSVNKPSDWLAQEAEYLIRIAARTLWLEQDVATAISLLRDADTRLAELKNPQYLPVRQAIHQDIESLNLLPSIKSETVVLTLMGLTKQINQLPIAMAHLPDASVEKVTTTVTDNAADWQSNLAIIWQDFLDKFFTVSRRTSSVEALLTPDQQQNLRQNLSLKLQMAQWAITQQSTEVYQTALNDVEEWLQGYFDLDTVVVQQFMDSVVQLKSNNITMPDIAELNSLPKIRQLLEQQNNRSRQSSVAPVKKGQEEVKVEQQNQPDNKEPLL